MVWLWGSIDENISMADMRKFSSFGFIKLANHRKLSRILGYTDTVHKTKVKLYPAAINKGILAKWLTRNSDIIISVNLPGIDIGQRTDLQAP